MNLDQKLEALASLRAEFCELLEYGDPESLGQIINRPDAPWAFDDQGDEKYLVLPDGEGDYYMYLVSSYGAKGEDYYDSEYGDKMIVMTNTDDEYTHENYIWVLSIVNKMCENDTESLLG